MALCKHSEQVRQVQTNLKHPAAAKQYCTLLRLEKQGGRAGDGCVTAAACAGNVLVIVNCTARPSFLPTSLQPLSTVKAFRVQAPPPGPKAAIGKCASTSVLQAFNCSLTQHSKQVHRAEAQRPSCTTAATLSCRSLCLRYRSRTLSFWSQTLDCQVSELILGSLSPYPRVATVVRARSPHGAAPTQPIPINSTLLSLPRSPALNPAGCPTLRGVPHCFTPLTSRAAASTP